MSPQITAEEREQAGSALAALGGDPQPFIRWNAAVVAGLIGGKGALDLLTAEAQVADEHANTRFRVALALGLLGDPQGLPVLERYAGDTYQIGGYFLVRAFAALGLGLLGDPAGIPTLRRLAADPEPAVRWHAAVALGDIGDPEATVTLVSLTEDPVPFVRAHAAIALALYTDPTGQPGHRPGALQVVFCDLVCDLGTPKGDGGWSVYEELRAQLAARGVAPSLVRFVHEAGDDRAKAELFAACRDGRVAVLVGSTEKMGVGTNVQARLVALHHLDCPWRPADIAQREGRALRQGNQNPQVEIVRYVTEGSFDVFMWQTVERKAGFVHQVMAGDVAGREVDDIGDTALSYAEVKALATGNPLILEKAGVDNDVARLTRLRQAHDRDQTTLARTVTQAEARAARLDELANLAGRAITRRVDTSGDRFTITVGETTFRKRPDGGAHLKQALAAALASAGTTDDHTAPVRTVGSFGGFPLDVSVRRDASGPLVAIGLGDSPIELVLTPSELAQADPQGLVTRLENRLRSLEETRDNALADRDRLRHEAGAAKARLGVNFPHTERLRILQRRQAEIERELLPEPEPLDTHRGPADPISPAPAVVAQAYPPSSPTSVATAAWRPPPAARPAAPHPGQRL